MLQPNFPEALFLLCVILITSGQQQKAISLIVEFEASHNRMLPFTYLFKGVSEYEIGNFVQAIEHFQNANQFYKLQQNQIANNEVSSLKPNYPLVDDSVSSMQLKGHVFNEMFGIFGRHKYTVTVWQY